MGILAQLFNQSSLSVAKAATGIAASAGFPTMRERSSDKREKQQMERGSSEAPTQETTKIQLSWQSSRGRQTYVWRGNQAKCSMKMQVNYHPETRVLWHPGDARV